MDQVTLQQKIKTMPGLPTLPAVALQLHEMFRDPRSSASEIGGIIRQDPGLAAHLLRLVNAQFYGFARKIPNVDQAIVTLGFRKVRQVALSAWVPDGFQYPPYLQLYAELCEHAQSIAMTADALARFLPVACAEEAFTAGLLHDMGKMAIWQCFPEIAWQISELEATGVSSSEAEQCLLEGNHALLGSWLAQEWNFPHSLMDTIQMHHRPDLAPENQELVALVFIANAFVHQQKKNEDGVPQIPKEIQEAVGLTPESIEEFAQIMANDLGRTPMASFSSLPC